MVDIGDDNLNCPVDYDQTNRGEAGNQHRLRSLLMLGREMIDEKPLDCYREQVAAERIETGETLCNYVTQQTQQRGEKLVWGVPLGALRVAAKQG